MNYETIYKLSEFGEFCIGLLAFIPICQSSLLFVFDLKVWAQ